jgi:hypothetical protein
MWWMILRTWLKKKNNQSDCAFVHQRFWWTWQNVSLSFEFCLQKRWLWQSIVSMHWNDRSFVEYEAHGPKSLLSPKLDWKIQQAEFKRKKWEPNTSRIEIQHKHRNENQCGNVYFDTGISLKFNEGKLLCNFFCRTRKNLFCSDVAFLRLQTIKQNVRLWHSTKLLYFVVTFFSLDWLNFVNIVC